MELNGSFIIRKEKNEYTVKLKGDLEHIGFEDSLDGVGDWIKEAVRDSCEIVDGEKGWEFS